MRLAPKCSWGEWNFVDFVDENAVVRQEVVGASTGPEGSVTAWQGVQQGCR